MKKGDVHPKSRLVVFQDISTNKMFLTKSTIQTKQTIKYTDGNDYPLYVVEISSASHPFYTGKQQLVDTSGTLDRFKKRYNLK